MAGLDIATSSNELVATTVNELSGSITYVSPSSLITKIRPLYAQGDDVKPPAPRATRRRTSLFRTRSQLWH
jgi:hypothetical protein